MLQGDFKLNVTKIALSYATGVVKEAKPNCRVYCLSYTAEFSHQNLMHATVMTHLLDRIKEQLGVMSVEA